MWHVEELFVLSDLHLSAERNAGAFQSDVELAECLRWIRTQTHGSLLVLAGDVLDLLTPDGEGEEPDFNRPAKLANEIIECHPEVFDELSALARDPGHGLVIMGGDRDAELIFPAVREAVERRLGTSIIGPTLRWLVHGEALRLSVGDAAVLVEHGNNWDPWNRIKHATLQTSLSLASRNLSDVTDYQRPLGARLALELGRELRSDYKWIDCLRPETEVLLPLLLHFASPEQRDSLFELADEDLSMKATARSRKNSHNPDKLYEGEREAEDSPRTRAFKGWVDEILPLRPKPESSTPTNGHTPETNGHMPERLRAHLVERLRAVSAHGTSFELEKPDGSDEHLQPTFDGGTDLIIHGHTHAAKAYTVGRGLYLNTGTWCQLLRLPRSDQSAEAWQDFLRLLQTNDVKSFRRPTLAHAQHVPAKKLTTAELLEWQTSGPKVLSQRRFTGKHTGWRKES